MYEKKTQVNYAPGVRQYPWDTCEVTVHQHVAEAQTCDVLLTPWQLCWSLRTEQHILGACFTSLLPQVFRLCLVYAVQV